VGARSITVFVPCD